ncbi:MAG: hypothetical protein ACRENX_02975 [Candidatus Dormibacteria bacterium]
MNEMTLGDLHVASTGRTVAVTGQSATKTADLRGRAELFSVRSAAWEMIIAHNRWSNGDREIVLHNRGTAPQRFDRFRSARRLGLTRIGAGECFVELMQAQMGERDHPTLRKVELAELSLGAGCDAKAVLTEMGAKVGTRASVIGDTGNHGSRYCARFPSHATEIAVVAYVLTRIAPFHRQIRA